jgi:hypothetical protein
MLTEYLKQHNIACIHRYDAHSDSYTRKIAFDFFEAHCECRCGFMKHVFHVVVLYIPPKCAETWWVGLQTHGMKLVGIVENTGWFMFECVYFQISQFIQLLACLEEGEKRVREGKREKR